MIVRKLAAFVVALSLAGSAAGCNSLPVPRAGSHPARGVEGHEEPQQVPYPPDPGKVEIISPRPPELKHPVWVDGQWDWTGSRWQWKEGGWEDEPPDMYYAPPILSRLDDGTLVYKRGRWTKLPATK